MSEQDKKEQEVTITFSDMFLLCKKKKRTILFWTLAFAFLAAFYQVSRPIQYLSKATFREKAKTSSDSNKPLSLAFLVGSGDSNENAALSTMKSRKLAEQVVIKRNLQANLQKDQWKFDVFNNIKNNLKVELAYLRNSLEPAIKDPKEPIKIVDVVYDGEVPVRLKLRFINEEQYQVSDRYGKDIGSGKIGSLFLGPDYSFSVARQDESPVTKAKYKLTIESPAVSAEKQILRLKCASDAKDKCLIKLNYKHPSRHEASEFINTLMALYQAYLRNEHRRVSNEQIAYLNKRQNETGSNLKKMMEEHAHALSNNMATMDFLFQTQQSYTQKLLLIDMELRRLQKARNEGIVFYERYWIDGGDPAVINKILGDIREHKQQADSIDIALRNNVLEDAEQLKKNFSSQMEELEYMKKASTEAKALHAALQNGTPLPQVPYLTHNPKYMIDEWQTKLETCAAENFAFCKQNFNAYLSNLVHLLEVEEKIVQERLTHQQGGQLEFQGIDLPTANHLYITYSKSLNDCEAEILHDQFILNQMKDPNFEPSSLSSVLEDSVSREIISKASNLLLMIRDQDNRSQRELDRLRTELDQQKGFLALHLEQTIQLLQLRKKLFTEKILSLQNAQLELIQQKISVLEQHLADYIDSRIANMKQERQSIEQQQESLKKEMAKMPEKWTSEKLIEQHLEMNKKMVEQITSMVESKNISAHLDISQSAPMDPSLPPLHPIRSNFLLFGFLGAFLGFLISVSAVVGKAVVDGIYATSDILTSYKQKVAGALTKHVAMLGEQLRDDDLDTLRRVSMFVNAEKIMDHGEAVLLMLGKGFDYSVKLAQLLNKSGSKVLLLRISFDQPVNASEEPGLLSYLKGEASWPKINSNGSFDSIAAGGISRFSNEYIKSLQFQWLLEKLKEEYDWVLAVTTTSPVSGEGQSLVPLFDQTLLSISDERLDDLKPYFTNKKAVYIFQNEG